MSIPEGESENREPMTDPDRELSPEAAALVIEMVYGMLLDGVGDKRTQVGTGSRDVGGSTITWFSEGGIASVSLAVTSEPERPGLRNDITLCLDGSSRVVVGRSDIPDAAYVDTLLTPLTQADGVMVAAIRGVQRKERLSHEVEKRIALAVGGQAIADRKEAEMNRKIMGDYVQGGFASWLGLLAPDQYDPRKPLESFPGEYKPGLDIPKVVECFDDHGALLGYEIWAVHIVAIAVRPEVAKQIGQENEEKRKNITMEINKEQTRILEAIAQQHPDMIEDLFLIDRDVFDAILEQVPEDEDKYVSLRFYREDGAEDPSMVRVFYLRTTSVGELSRRHR